jgi:hypothetical protein
MIGSLHVFFATFEVVKLYKEKTIAWLDDNNKKQKRTGREF